MDQPSDLSAARAAVRSSLHAGADGSDGRAAFRHDGVEDFVLSDVEARTDDAAAFRCICSGPSSEQAKADGGRDRLAELIDHPGARNGERGSGSKQQTRAVPIGEKREAMPAGACVVIGKALDTSCPRDRGERLQRTPPNPADRRDRRVRRAILRPRAAPPPSSRRRCSIGRTVVTAKACQRAAYRRTRDGVNLSSGWPETGSTWALISASTRPALAYCCDQCIGTKIVPRFCWLVTTTRATMRPWRLSMTARSSAATPAALASSRMHLDERLGEVAHQARRLARPRHCVPLVAHPAGVERERIVRRSFGRTDRETASARTAPLRSGVKKRPFAKNRVVVGDVLAWARPLERLERLVRRG